MNKFKDIVEQKVCEAIAEASEEAKGQINLSSESAQISLAKLIVQRIEKDLERWPSGRRHWS